jgi:hypothetical protein
MVNIGPSQTRQHNNISGGAHASLVPIGTSVPRVSKGHHRPIVKATIKNVRHGAQPPAQRGPTQPRNKEGHYPVRHKVTKRIVGCLGFIASYCRRASKALRSSTT